MPNEHSKQELHKKQIYYNEHKGKLSSKLKAPTQTT
jgi:hypothetical protein